MINWLSLLVKWVGLLRAAPGKPVESSPAKKRTRPPACPNCKGQGWMPCICSVPHICPICCGSRTVPAIYLAGMASGPDPLEARMAYVRNARWRN